jgi:hypothetical protein
VLCLGGTAFFLFKAGEFSLPEKLFISAMISLTVVNCGVLFENRRWVRWSETIRIIFFPILLFWVFKFNLNFIEITAAFTYLLVSLAWFIRITKHDKIIPT